MTTKIVDDDVLLSVALLERVKPFLNMNTREPISKVGLQRIRDGVTKSIEKLSSKVTNGEITKDILTTLLEMDELIGTVLSEQTFVETDDVVKNIMVDKLMPTLDTLYKEAAIYYTTRQFNFKPGLEKLLIRIIDKAIEQGVTFGYEEVL